MNKKMLFRIAFPILAIAIVAALGWYSYSLIKSHNEKTDMNLFGLVPPSATAIWETNNVYEVMTSINKPGYYDKYDSLYFSEIISFLISNVEKVTDIKAHGSNKKTTNMLVSFHTPNTPKDQVLYCKLSLQEKEHIEKFIREHTSINFHPKTFQYRNENITIYPVRNDDFLAFFYHPEFLAVSYQEKLIEQVIDAYIDQQSVLSDSIFAQAFENKEEHSASTIYLRSNVLPFEFKTEDNTNQWIEFDLKMNKDAIYLAGTTFEADSCTSSFTKVMQAQKPIKTLPSEHLPESTFFFQQFAVTDMGSLISHLNQRAYPIEVCNNATEQADSSMFVFLKENTENRLCSFMFTTSQPDIPFSSIVHVPLKNRNIAENRFRGIQTGWAKQFTNNRYLYPNYHFNKGGVYTIYEMPGFMLLDKLTGISKGKEQKYYGCFYHSYFLISPYKSSLTDYISLMENETTKENDLVFQECIAGLAPESTGIILTDLGEISNFNENFNHLIPPIFLNNQGFFKHFILAVQYTHNNGNLSPNISLIYKEEQA